MRCNSSGEGEGNAVITSTTNDRSTSDVVGAREVDDVITGTSNDAGVGNTRTSQVDGVSTRTTKEGGALDVSSSTDQGITSATDVDITRGDCTSEGSRVSTSTTKKGGVVKESRCTEGVIATATKDGGGSYSGQSEGVVGSTGGHGGADQRSSKCEAIHTLTTNNRSVGNTSTEAEGVVGSTTNQRGSGNATSTGEQSSTGTQVCVDAAVESVDLQGVSTGSTVNSGTGDSAQGDVVSTASGIGRGSISVDGDVGCISNRNQVSTSTGVEGVAVDAVSPALEVLMNIVSLPLPALTVELTNEPIERQRVAASESVEIDVDDLVGWCRTEEDGVSTRTAINR